MPYRAVPCRTVPYRAVPCRRRTVPCCGFRRAVLSAPVRSGPRRPAGLDRRTSPAPPRCRTGQQVASARAACLPVLSCPVLSCFVQSCSVLSCPILSCIALHCATALPCPVRLATVRHTPNTAIECELPIHSRLSLLFHFGRRFQPGCRKGFMYNDGDETGVRSHHFWSTSPGYWK